MKNMLIYGLVFIFACTGNEENGVVSDVPPPSNPQTVEEKENENAPITYLALGDSYTIGQSVEEAARWPYQLRDSLRSRDIAINDLKIIARTGWSTDQLLDAMDADEDLDNNEYTIVSLLIGVNNQYRGLSFQTFQNEFRELLNRAVVLAGRKRENVFVLSIPDYSVTPFVIPSDKERIADELEMYNQRSLEICNELGITYFNITPISQKAADDSSYIASDNLHPSGKMYAEWAGLIVDDVARKLN